MRIIHVASYKDEFFNGIKSVLVDLIPAQRALGHHVWIFNHELNNRCVIEEERYIRSIRDFIKEIIVIIPDLVIFHSLYGLADVAFSLYLRHKKIPYLVEPHGGTSFDNARKNYFKKKIANLVYANNYLSHATGLIYLNEKECKDCVFKRIRKSYAIIPNGTSMPELKENYKSTNVVRFVFLARIDIIQKGLDLLFPAIEEANRRGLEESVEFHFYGKARIPRWEQAFSIYMKNASRNVFFHGPAIGHNKETAFRDGDIFILTSRYEGMPMAVLEALSYGLPCLLTPQTNMTDIISEKRCGWIVKPSVDSICSGIIAATSDFLTNRENLIKNALAAARLFDWGTIATHSIREYKRLLEENAYA